MTSSFTPCASTPPAASDPWKHVNYVLGMVLGVPEFIQEFAYQSGRDRFLARDLFGYGTVSGLKVTTDKADGKTRVLVTAGVAVDPQGEIIRVPRSQCALLDDWIAANSQAVVARVGAPSAQAVKLYVVLSYRKCPTEHRPIPGELCRTAAQSTAPTMWMDDFQLTFCFDRPVDAGVEAMRVFVQWLSLVEVTDEPGPFATLDQFEAAVRAAGQMTSPIGLLPFGSPLSALRVHTYEAPAFFRAAYRIWVTELRPAWAGQIGGDAPAETRVLLAELGVPVVQAGGQWTLDKTRVVTVDESSRPFLIPMHMAQEWPGRPAAAAVRQATAFGRFDEHGNALASVGNLKASRPIKSDRTVFLLTFDGWSATAHYVVKGVPLVGFKTPGGAFFMVIRPDDMDLKEAMHGEAPAGIVVRSGVPARGTAMSPVGFSVEITQV
jgi:hypothetical protein